MMNQRQLASVLLAVLGLFLAAFRLPDAFLQGGMLARWDPTGVDPAAPVSQRFVLVLALTASAIAVLLGLTLVFLRERIASTLFSVSTAPLQARDLQAVAFSVLGCYFVIQGLHNAMMWFGGLRWGGVVQAALGLGLFVGANRLATLWARRQATDGPRRADQSAV
jgi:hypothetical protein